MAYECEMHDQPAMPVLAIRMRTPVEGLPAVMGKAFGDVMQYMGAVGACPAGPPFAIYYNMDMQALDVEMGFPVVQAAPGQGAVQASEIPAGKYAGCVHVGPYGEMAAAYAALTAWVTEQGMEPTGVAMEVYLTEPTVPPQDMKTQIIFPLKGE